MKMDQSRWDFLEAYSVEVFGAQDDHLAHLMGEAVASGIPDIAVSADVGHLLQILTEMTPGRLALEVGTLAGYSAIWIARGLKPGGRLITIEIAERHAEFARRQFQTAGVSDRVEVRLGAGIEVLEALASELEPGSVDVLFMDAIKHEYPEYFSIARPLVAPGGLVLADNVYATGEGWIDEGHGTDAFNRMIATDPDFTAVAVPLRQGVLIARRAD
jgi:predicted O-methyltransferase YrrM